MDVRVAQPGLEMKKLNGKVYPVAYSAREGLVEDLRKSISQPGVNVNLVDEHGLSPLHYAARFNQVETAELLLRSGANPNVTGVDLGTPLHAAAVFNCVDVFRLLLRHGADIGAKNAQGATVMHLAAKRGNHEILQHVLEYPRLTLGIDEKDNEQMTPLHHACGRAHAQSCATLVQNGAQIRELTGDQRTPLHLATQTGSLAIVTLLLLTAENEGSHNVKNYVNTRDEFMSSALHIAARGGHYDICQLLIENGAEVVDERSTSPLHNAAMGGHLSVVELLLTKGAEIDALDPEDNTPLHRAALYNRVEVAKVLLDKGAKINARTNSNKTPLMCTVIAGHLPMAEMLAKRGACLKDTDNFQKSCLHHAVESENLNTARFLLESNTGPSLVDCRDKNDQTPLHYAAKKGLLQLIDELLKYSKSPASKDVHENTPLHLACKSGFSRSAYKLAFASPGSCNDPDDMGETPLHHAVRSNKRKICSLLLEMGSNINAKDDSRQTPLHCAAETGSVEILELLLSQGAHIDASDLNKNTALHTAANKGNDCAVTYLLDKQADVCLKTVSGETALDLAIDKSEECAKVMLQHARWKEIMSNRDENEHSPLKKLIKQYPEGAEIIMSRCIEPSAHAQSDPDFTLTFDISILDPGPDDPAALKRKRFFGPKTMVNYKREELLNHPLTSALLSFKWTKFGRAIYYMNFAFYMILVICFSAFVADKRSDMVLGVAVNNDSDTDTEYQESISQNNMMGGFLGRFTPFIVLFFALFQMFKEIAQMFTLRLKYFLDFWNYLEWAMYGCAMYFMAPYWFILLDIQFGTQNMWIAATISIFLMYINLCLFMQRFSWFGLYVTMLVDVLKTALVVLFVFSLLFFGFAFVFFILLKEQNVFGTYERSLLKVLIMTVGEIDYSTIIVDAIDQTNSENNAPLVPYRDLTYIFMTIFVIVMPIVVMNLLVGLAVGDIDLIRTNANFQKVSNQVDYVSAVENNYPKFLTRRMYLSKIVYKPNAVGLKSWFSKALFRYRYGMSEEIVDEFHKINSKLVAAEKPNEEHLLAAELAKQKEKMKSLICLVKNQQRYLEAITTHLNIKPEPLANTEAAEMVGSALSTEDLLDLVDPTSKL